MSNVSLKEDGPILLKGFKRDGQHVVKGDGNDMVALCRCGMTTDTPFCSGAHREKGWSAGGANSAGDKIKKDTCVKAVKLAENGPALLETDGGDTVAMCRCGQSSNKPYCDGTHSKVDWKAGATTDIEDLAKKSGAEKNGTAAATSSASGGGDTVRSLKHDGDPVSTNPFEPTMALIKEMARDGYKNHHGPMAAMGFPRAELPLWEDLQFVTAQAAVKPLLDDAPVDTRLVIGPRAKRPLVLDLPVFVSDMSFGSLSKNAKLALSRGAELAGTGICSGEGGAMPEEMAANSRYFYEYASAGFGFTEELFKKARAVHLKFGQAAKTATGGHLPAKKVTKEIAAVRGLKEGEDAISPASFPHLSTLEDFKAWGERMKEVSGGVPFGFKLSAQHVEADVDFAVRAGADYIILDGRGGGTGAAPTIFRNNISVPTIPALARARRRLDALGAKHVTLIATGGLRTPADFCKALALGADGVAIANSALQAIGCVGARQCNTNQCPAGIATQDPDLTPMVNVEAAAKQLCNFFEATKGLMSVLARACGHSKLSQFNIDDLTTYLPHMSMLSGVKFGGVSTQVVMPSFDVAPAAANVKKAPRRANNNSRSKNTRNKNNGTAPSNATTMNNGTAPSNATTMNNGTAPSNAATNVTSSGDNAAGQKTPTKRGTRGGKNRRGKNKAPQVGGAVADAVVAGGAE